MTTSDKIDRAITAFQIAPFARAVGGRKESPSPLACEWLFTCPHCGSSRLRFNAQKRAGTCWGCRRGFNTFTLVRDVLKLDELEAVQWFITRYVGGDSTAGALASALTPIEAPKPAVRRLPQIEWPEGAEVLTAPCAPHARAWDYLTRRGIDAAMVREFGLAYGRASRTRERIVFPCRMDGTLVYWQARATWDPPPHLKGAELREWKEKTGYIKSINPLVRSALDPQAHEVLFNYERASVEQHVVICEGPVDAIKVGPHAIALLGKVAGPVKLERLKRMRARRFTIYLDNGDEERASALVIARELSAMAEVRICAPPPDYDAGALDRATNARIVAGAVPWVPRI